MHILNGGRESFLSFLRNMTSQAVIFAAGTVLVVKHNLHFSSFIDPNKTEAFLFALLCFVYGFLSMIASTSLFMEQYLKSLKNIPPINKIHFCQKNKECSPIQQARCILPYVFIHKPVIFMELMFLLITPLLSITIVIFSAIGSSGSFLKMLGILH